MPQSVKQYWEFPLSAICQFAFWRILWHSGFNVAFGPHCVARCAMQKANGKMAGKLREREIAQRRTYTLAQGLPYASRKKGYPIFYQRAVGYVCYIWYVNWKVTIFHIEIKVTILSHNYLWKHMDSYLMCEANRKAYISTYFQNKQTKRWPFPQIINRRAWGLLLPLNYT